MKKLLLTTAFIAIAASANAEILAKVNGRPITRQEVEASLSEVATMEDGAEPKLETFPIDFQRAFVDKYVEKLLIIEQARKTGVAKDPDVLEEVKNFEDNLIQQKYLTDLVIKERTDKKLRDIYNSKFKAKEGKQEVHASHILVKTEAEAKKVRSELDGGADFEELADKYSIDPGAKISSGDLGYFTEDEKVAEFSKAAFAMKKGEISQPIKTEFGWHIIKVYDKRKFNAPNYAQALSDIEGALATEVIDTEVKGLKSNAKIEYLSVLAGKPAIVKKAPLKPNNLAAESNLPIGEKAKIPVAPKPAAAPAVTKPATPAKVDAAPKAAAPAPTAAPVAKPVAPKPAATPKPVAAKPAPVTPAVAPATVPAKPTVSTNFKTGLKPKVAVTPAPESDAKNSDKD